MAKSLDSLRGTRPERFLVRFAGDCSGAIAMLFALIVVPLLLVVGMSIDYGHATTYQTSMQRVLDEAVIAGATALAKTNDAARAEAAARRRFEATRPTAYPITLIVAAGVSCRHQIKHGTTRQALHPAEVLRDALRG